jgi:hypothetical protein
VQPDVTGDGADDGIFLATPVYLYMAGRWELRLALTGSVDDAATFTVDIP